MGHVGGSLYKIRGQSKTVVIKHVRCFEHEFPCVNIADSDETSEDERPNFDYSTDHGSTTENTSIKISSEE